MIFNLCIFVATKNNLELLVCLSILVMGGGRTFGQQNEGIFDYTTITSTHTCRSLIRSGLFSRIIELDLGKLQPNKSFPSYPTIKFYTKLSENYLTCITATTVTSCQISQSQNIYQFDINPLSSVQTKPVRLIDGLCTMLRSKPQYRTFALTSTDHASAKQTKWTRL